MDTECYIDLCPSAMNNRSVSHKYCNLHTVIVVRSQKTISYKSLIHDVNTASNYSL